MKNYKVTYPIRLNKNRSKKEGKKAKKRNNERQKCWSTRRFLSTFIPRKNVGLTSSILLPPRSNVGFAICKSRFVSVQKGEGGGWGRLPLYTWFEVNYWNIEISTKFQQLSQLLLTPSYFRCPLKKLWKRNKKWACDIFEKWRWMMNMTLSYMVSTKLRKKWFGKTFFTSLTDTACLRKLFKCNWSSWDSGSVAFIQRSLTRRQKIGRTDKS